MARLEIAKRTMLAQMNGHRAGAALRNTNSSVYGCKSELGLYAKPQTH